MLRRICVPSFLVDADACITAASYGCTSITIWVYFYTWESGSRVSYVTSQLAEIDRVCILANAHGLKVQLCVEGDIAYDGGHFTPATLQDYHTAYDAIFAALEVDTRIEGYVSENMADVAWEFLRSATNKQITMWAFWQNETFAHLKTEILPYIDEVVWELWTTLFAEDCVNTAIGWLHANAPHMPFGLHHFTCQQGYADQYQTQLCAWYPHNPPCAVGESDYSLPDLIDTATYWIDAIKAKYADVVGRPIDIEMPCGARSDEGGSTLAETLTINEGLGISECVGTDVTRWVTEPERLTLTPVETNSAVVHVTSEETVTLVITEAMVKSITSSEIVILATTETSRASPLSPETVALKNVETRTAIASVGSAEIVTLFITELSKAKIGGVVTLGSAETIYLDITETQGHAVPAASSETILLKTTELSDPNFFYAPPSWVKAHPVDYTLEVRRLNTETGGWDFLGVLDQRIAPSIQREVGLADVLTFNLLLSDPKTTLFMGPLKGLEVWYYGRDALLKQVFKVQKVEVYRDYGGSGGGSGGSTLGSGSGDGMLIVADGPESYLSEKFITYDYRAVQKRPYEILKNILEGIWDTGIGLPENTFADVDSSLNGKLIDMTISWESSKAAIDSLIQQIGGVLEITIAPDGIRRTIRIVPLPGEVIPTASAGGGAFNVSRRFGTPEPSQDTLPVLAYNAFPPRGNAIISNNSSAQIDAHAHMNNFMTLKSGATAWDFIEGGDDRIQAAYAMEIANLSSYTIESCIYIGTQTTTGSGYDGARIFSKEQVYGAFELIYDATYQRLMYVRGTDDKNVDAWVTADNTVPENDWYYIQLTRDGTTGPDDELPPNIIVDNVVLNLTQFSVATGMWDNDFLNDLYIGNDSTLAHPFIGKLSLFRIYNYAILDSLSSFLHDGWRRDPTTAQITLDSFPTPGRMITQGAM